jgi:hypothetical protein
MLNLIGVIIAFILILILIRKKINFALSLTIGALIIGLFSLETITPLDIPKAFIEASIYTFNTQQIHTDILELAILMTLILMLAKCMQETKAITHLIDSLRTFFSKGGTIAVIPAVYGLMPIPGGALFSAPLIDQEGTTHGLTNDQKNVLNVWFRHMWFPIFPLSQTMILIASFGGIPIGTLILADIPVFIAYALIGYLYMRHYMKPTQQPPKTTTKDYSGLKYLIPPLIPLPFYALTFLDISEITETRAFIIGVIIGIISLFLLLKIDWKTTTHILRKSLSWNLALAIFAIMIFRQMIQLSGVDTLIAAGMKTYAFPALAIILLFPLIIGILIGSDFASVALSFPIVAPFIAATGISTLGCTALIFMAINMAYLISPIHLCNVLSSDYLHTDVTRMYKMYIPTTITVLLIHLTAIILLFHT